MNSAAAAATAAASSAVALRRCGAQDRRSTRTRSQHRVPRPSAHAAPRHRLQAGPTTGHAGDPALSGTPQHSAYHPLHRTSGRSVQGFLARLAPRRILPWPASARSCTSTSSRATHSAATDRSSTWMRSWRGWSWVDGIFGDWAYSPHLTKTTPFASGPNTVIQNRVIATITTTIAKAWA